MKAYFLGLIQVTGALAALYFDGDVFAHPTGISIAIGILAVLFGIVGLHHLGCLGKED